MKRTRKRKKKYLEENTWINTEMNKEVMKYINVNNKKVCEEAVNKSTNKENDNL